ncbi:hypothetical protein SSP531S_59220 [Streptomyces spongiicola]|uniref:Uncharacterized protein n=1 Tax=Streptomyces spongiicola TaxID=1690221 RepID=A0A388T793_9ACTN|nr:hypothetical protein SSP531S_59220 [Streptomyces spongiicola]
MDLRHWVTQVTQDDAAIDRLRHPPFGRSPAVFGARVTQVTQRLSTSDKEGGGVCCGAWLRE